MALHGVPLFYWTTTAVLALVLAGCGAYITAVEWRLVAADGREEAFRRAALLATVLESPGIGAIDTQGVGDLAARMADGAPFDLFLVTVAGTVHGRRLFADRCAPYGAQHCPAAQATAAGTDAYSRVIRGESGVVSTTNYAGIGVTAGYVWCPQRNLGLVVESPVPEELSSVTGVYCFAAALSIILVHFVLQLVGEHIAGALRVVGLVIVYTVQLFPCLLVLAVIASTESSLTLGRKAMLVEATVSLNGVIGAIKAIDTPGGASAALSALGTLHAAALANSSASIYTPFTASADSFSGVLSFTEARLTFESSVVRNVAVAVAVEPATSTRVTYAVRVDRHTDVERQARMAFPGLLLILGIAFCILVPVRRVGLVERNRFVTRPHFVNSRTYTTAWLLCLLLLAAVIPAAAMCQTTVKRYSYAAAAHTAATKALAAAEQHHAAATWLQASARALVTGSVAPALPPALAARSTFTALHGVISAAIAERQKQAMWHSTLVRNWTTSADALEATTTIASVLRATSSNSTEGLVAAAALAEEELALANFVWSAAPTRYLSDAAAADAAVSAAVAQLAAAGHTTAAAIVTTARAEAATTRSAFARAATTYANTQHSGITSGGQQLVSSATASAFSAGVDLLRAEATVMGRAVDRFDSVVASVQGDAHIQEVQSFAAAGYFAVVVASVVLAVALIVSVKGLRLYVTLLPLVAVAPLLCFALRAVEGETTLAVSSWSALPAIVKTCGARDASTAAEAASCEAWHVLAAIADNASYFPVSSHASCATAPTAAADAAELMAELPRTPGPTAAYARMLITDATTTAVRSACGTNPRAQYLVSAFVAELRRAPLRQMQLSASAAPVLAALDAVAAQCPANATALALLRTAARMELQEATRASVDAKWYDVAQLFAANPIPPHSLSRADTPAPADGHWATSTMWITILCAWAATAVGVVLLRFEASLRLRLHNVDEYLPMQ